MERVPKGKGVMQGQQQQQPPKRCPRCESTNTKFCYYNNYSQSQPRHFCKACRRYWTEGGTLRNVPQGGGNRKGKRPRKAPAAASSSGSGAVSAGPEALPLPSPSSLFYIGGGVGGGVMGLQPFHPGSDMIGDFGGFHAGGDQAVMPPAFNPSMLPGFLNFPPLLLPPLDTNPMIQPRAPSHQQLNTTTVFTSTTAGPTVTAAGGDGGEAFWNDLANGEEGSGNGDGQWNTDPSGSGSRPPTPSSFI